MNGIKKENMGRTASTMPCSKTQTNFSLFGQRKRTDKRLNSTIRFSPSQGYRNKFSPLREKHLDWHKWKANSFPVVWDGFTGMLKKRAEKV